MLSRSINGKGGNLRGIELAAQHAFTSLPAPFDGLGFSANYSYNESDIKEYTSDFPMSGTMKHNGGLTLWYEKGGYEARVSAKVPHAAATVAHRSTAAATKSACPTSSDPAN